MTAWHLADLPPPTDRRKAGKAPQQAAPATSADRADIGSASTSPASRGNAIVCTNLGRHFVSSGKRIDVLHEANISIAAGEFVSLLGPSGCGKSTLLMIAAGLDHPSAGEVRIFGEILRGPYRHAGIVFQDPTLLPWKTALANVLLPLDLAGERDRFYRDRALDLLEQVGLRDAIDRRPRQLSGGMRQRVALCRALIKDPRILFLDEPFSALDAISRDEMNSVLLQLWGRFSKTALFVTHSVREAALLSDRVLVMGKHAGAPIADVRIPFSRPREFSLTTTLAFNTLCESLRSMVADAYQDSSASRARNV